MLNQVRLQNSFSVNPDSDSQYKLHIKHLSHQYIYESIMYSFLVNAECEMDPMNTLFLYCPPVTLDHHIMNRVLTGGLRG